MSIELNKESVEQADASSCQGTNCGTTTGDHSSECLAEAAAGQGWELKPGDLCGRDCPIHKISVEQAGGDERAAFEVWASALGWKLSPDQNNCGIVVAERYGHPGVQRCWEAWQARAALAQPYPKSGDYSDQSWINAGCPPEQPEQAEAERLEVVARVVHSNPIVLGQCGPLNANDELMTVAQHAASVARWAEMFNRVEQQRDAALAEVERLRESKGDPVGSLEKCMKVMYERDENAKRLEVALARVTELEGKLTDWVHEGFRLNEALAVAKAQHSVPEGLAEFSQFLSAVMDAAGLVRYGRRSKELSEYLGAQCMKYRLSAPVAQAQQLNDLDKQCRDDVARALGLRPNQERGFAWSYLLASIKSCVKASGDSAQAQHSVPVPIVTPEMVMAAMAVFRLDVSPFKSMEAALIAALRKAAAPGKEGV
ncbi:TPA: hypothetical protein ACLEAJ_005077 [Pseudomonas aeruginosa]